MSNLFILCYLFYYCYSLQECEVTCEYSYQAVELFSQGPALGPRENALSFFLGALNLCCLSKTQPAPTDLLFTRKHHFSIIKFCFYLRLILRSHLFPTENIYLDVYRFKNNPYDLVEEYAVDKAGCGVNQDRGICCRGPCPPACMMKYVACLTYIIATATTA